MKKIMKHALYSKWGPKKVSKKKLGRISFSWFNKKKVIFKENFQQKKQLPQQNEIHPRALYKKKPSAK